MSPETYPELLDLFWRECAADVSLWDMLTGKNRLNWWDRAWAAMEKTDVTGQAFVKWRRLMALPLRDEDFADAWSVLGRAGNSSESRDGRRALYWWRYITPTLQAERVKATQQNDFGAFLWPAPQPEVFDSNAWREILARHFTALAELNAKLPRTSGTVHPNTLREAWYMAQRLLEPIDCLDLIYLLAYEPNAEAGQRWSFREPHYWANLLWENLRKELTEWVEVENRLSTVNIEWNAERRLALLLLAVLSSWHPAEVEELVEGIPKTRLAEFQEELAMGREVPSWLKTIQTKSLLPKN